MDPILNVAEHLRANAESLASTIVDDVVPTFPQAVPDEEAAQAKKVYTVFLQFLGASLLSDEDDIHQELVEWSKRNGELQAANGQPISNIIVRYPSTRSIFIDHLTAVSMAYQLPVLEMVKLNKRFNYLLDISLNETIFAFERLTNEKINDSRRRINELSAPIVSIQKGIGILPLIGLIDAERANYLLENTVPKIPSLDIECLIVDFSGILIIDNHIADQLIKVSSMLTLLGISIISTGIRPAIALAMVNEGVNLSSIKSYATVKQALEDINRQ